tara:strand:- start:801 stop:968 length:168 start_codon:yes stop_codon:yes gene_type:complete
MFADKRLNTKITDFNIRIPFPYLLLIFIRHYQLGDSIRCTEYINKGQDNNLQTFF